jgi:hypothetical protein
MAEKTFVRTPRDRWADWAVVGVVVVALLLGWGVMALAEGQRDTFSDEDTGLTVRYPKDWLLKGEEGLIFQVVDPDSSGFKTTYQVRVRPIDATAPTTPTLAAVLSQAALGRAQEGTAYRPFDVVEGEELDGQATMEATYVYVVRGSDLFMQRMPVVVLGLDIAVARGDQAYVFSLVAAQDSFEDAEPAFRRFVESAEIQ